MARTYRARYLGLMRTLEREMRTLFASLAVEVAQEVALRADAQGQVPRSATYELQRAAGERVMALFVGRAQNGEQAPFEVLSSGTVQPLSPYMRVLWAAITEAIRLAVTQHSDLLRRRLPPDLLALLGRPQRISEQVFATNPLARYDPPHTWVDPAGYTLSERIWRTAGDTRRRLDLYLDQAIREGRGALRMSRELEAFLLPGRTLRTRRPYGIDASYDAMRLARTETTRAHARAAEVSARVNPFVVGIRVVLSASHPRVDICDEAAAAGPWPVDEIPPEYQIPLHPHCLCSYRYEMGDTREIISGLRAEAYGQRDALIELIGLLQVEQLVRRLLGGVSMTRAEAA